ncbi:hypothetical protein JKP88DRAFT_252729 [Tribonema minus]|uniref:Uncharacterized protein n=1 Tax=Tribonema minus TaxID=303371 RepID=A0A835ZIH8_9STRA|nr:hypothetical protein JKP88DRAFT_252729 [Tribonema minus]
MSSAISTIAAAALHQSGMTFLKRKSIISAAAADTCAVLPSSTDNCAQTQTLTLHLRRVPSFLVVAASTAAATMSGATDGKAASPLVASSVPGAEDDAAAAAAAAAPIAGGAAQEGSCVLNDAPVLMLRSPCNALQQHAQCADYCAVRSVRMYCSTIAAATRPAPLLLRRCIESCCRQCVLRSNLSCQCTLRSMYAAQQRAATAARNSSSAHVDSLCALHCCVPQCASCVVLSAGAHMCCAAAPTEVLHVVGAAAFVLFSAHQQLLTLCAPVVVLTCVRNAQDALHIGAPLCHSLFVLSTVAAIMLLHVVGAAALVLFSAQQQPLLPLCALGATPTCVRSAQNALHAASWLGALRGRFVGMRDGQSTYWGRHSCSADRCGEECFQGSTHSVLGGVERDLSSVGHHRVWRLDGGTPPFLCRFQRSTYLLSHGVPGFARQNLSSLCSFTLEDIRANVRRVTQSGFIMDIDFDDNSTLSPVQGGAQCASMLPPDVRGLLVPVLATRTSWLHASMRYCPGLWLRLTRCLRNTRGRSFTAGACVPARCTPLGGCTSTRRQRGLHEVGQYNCHMRN